MTRETDMDAVVDALRSGDRFLVTTHENPDGDALGSLLAMHLALQALGKDSVMVLAGMAPLPAEYAFLGSRAHGLERERPGGRTGESARRGRLRPGDRGSPTSACSTRGVVVNVDHHHDNTRFGSVDLVVAEASSTAEVLADVFAALTSR